MEALAQLPELPRAFREIRAAYDDETVTMYQAYNDRIADAALASQRLAGAPGFSADRMTWIKPSFCWMMYRCGFAQKDANQTRVLAIHVRRRPLEEALGRAAVHEQHGEYDVRVQWDPERVLDAAQGTRCIDRERVRSIQIGLQRDASRAFAGDWIARIEDTTPLARAVKARLDAGDLAGAAALLPRERPYPVGPALARALAMNEEAPPAPAPPRAGAAPPRPPPAAAAHP
eukprot:tig00000254_g22578.t1